MKMVQNKIKGLFVTVFLYSLSLSLSLSLSATQIITSQTNEMEGLFDVTVSENEWFMFHF